MTKLQKPCGQNQLFQEVLSNGPMYKPVFVCPSWIQ